MIRQNEGVEHDKIKAEPGASTATSPETMTARHIRSAAHDSVPEAKPSMKTAEATRQAHDPRSPGKGEYTTTRKQAQYSNTSHLMVDEDTLARAVLTFLIDSADAFLFATIKGAGSAPDALRLITGRIDDRKNQNRLDEAFATGTARWGRRAGPQAMNAFHNALARWRDRLHLLPTCQAKVLTDWFTNGGTQWIIGPTSPYWPHQVDDLSVRKDWASPLCLWGYGDPRALTSCAKPLAVVGSRGVNDYGRYVARTVGKKAAEQGHLIISGGAIGGDAAAHWGALEAMGELGSEESGRTVAVFAGGLNHIGPERNHELFQHITSNGGALISELCPDTIPEPRRFLLRNRIIAALADTVVVAQARSRSGALNTANWAAELGRPVYAAPGNINIPSNTGCNWLIQEQRATILYSVNMTSEICHKRHAPLIAHGLGNSLQSSGQQTTKNSTVKSHEKQAISPDTVLEKSQDTTTPPHVTVAGTPSILESVEKARHDESTSEAVNSKDRNQAELDILETIQYCRRRKIPVTHDSLLQTLNREAPSADGDSEPTGSRWSVAKLEGMLGQMELDGFITTSRGIIEPTKDRR